MLFSKMNRSSAARPDTVKSFVARTPTTSIVSERVSLPKTETPVLVAVSAKVPPVATKLIAALDVLVINAESITTVDGANASFWNTLSELLSSPPSMTSTAPPVMAVVSVTLNVSLPRCPNRKKSLVVDVMLNVSSSANASIANVSIPKDVTASSNGTSMPLMVTEFSSTLMTS